MLVKHKYFILTKIIYCCWNSHKPHRIHIHSMKKKHSCASHPCQHPRKISDSSALIGKPNRHNNKHTQKETTHTASPTKCLHQEIPTNTNKTKSTAYITFHNKSVAIKKRLTRWKRAIRVKLEAGEFSCTKKWVSSWTRKNSIN